MAEERASTAPWLVAGILIPVLLLAAYVVGYFALERDEWYTSRSPTVPVSFSRSYPHPAIAPLHMPAARVEAWFVQMPGEVKVN